MKWLLVGALAVLVASVFTLSSLESSKEAYKATAPDDGVVIYGHRVTASGEFTLVTSK